MSLVSSLYERTFEGLEKAMHLQLRRHEALSANVANAETPQYRAVELTFGGELKRAFHKEPSSLIKTDKKHLDLVADSSAHLIQDLSGATKGDGNNVDIDLQMAKLNSNLSKYLGAAQLIQAKFRGIKNLLREVA
jgi:flagellar basal-body rod protein FlgB